MNVLRLERLNKVFGSLVVTDDAASRQGAASFTSLSSVDGFTITARASDCAP